MLKKLFIGGLLIALAGLFAFRFLQHGNRETSTAGRVGHRFPRVEVALVERGRIEEAVSVVGSLRAKRQVDVMPKLSGRVMELRVDRGDRVMAGELLARLDDAELRQQVRRAEAALRVAEAARAQRQAELDNLLAELERYRSLHQAGVISSQELDQTRTQVAVARAQLHLAAAQVEQAKAELQELQIRREQTRITAPMTGVIGKRYVDPGALVNPNTPIVTILDLETMVSVIHVPERKLVQLEVGTPATVIVDAVPDVRFAGRVVRISPLLD
ncbi:MAG: efflux RND transporter periplasmic adaptor subunit, partial [Acidobacteria bacterium]